MDIVSLIKPITWFGEKLYQWWRIHHPVPEAVLKARHKWKQEFETYLRNWKQLSSEYSDLIIRDVKRMDSYPDIDRKEKGISPWFKVELKGIYHRGFEVFMSIQSLEYIEDEDGWVSSHYSRPESLNAFLVGRIPFELIIDVDWNGDEYYYCPHVYCRFLKRKKQPYEDLIYYVEQGSGDHKYLRQVAKQEEVKKLSQKYSFLQTPNGAG